MRLELSNDGVAINLQRSPYKTQGMLLGLLSSMGGGKSWTLAVLAEAAHENHLPFIFYDVDGDAASLRELGDDVIIIGRNDQDEAIRHCHYPLMTAARDAENFIRLVLEEGFSLVVDLSGREEELKHIAFSRLMIAHYEMASQLREPVMVIVDEAHQFAPQKKVADFEGESKAALKKITSNGRKRGMLLALSTQRSTFLDKDVLFGMNVRLFGLCTYHRDYETLKPYLPRATSFSALKRLKAGEYFISSSNGFGKVKIKSRRTSDLGATPLFSSGKRKKRARPSVQNLQLSLFDKVKGRKE